MSKGPSKRESARRPAHRLLTILGPLVGLAVFLGALWALHHALRGYHYHQIAASLSAIPRAHLLLAGGLTVLNYLTLTGYDSLAFRYIDNPLGYRKIALASFIGYAFANNTGSLSLIAGTGVRYRLYSAWGLTSVDIAKVVGFCTVSFWLGFLSLGGSSFLLEPVAIPEALPIPSGSVHLLGAALLALAGGYLVWSGLRTRPLRLFSWEIPVPPLGLAFTQILVSVADWVGIGAVLFTLLPKAPGLSFPLFLGLFLLSQVIGLASVVPGGLGVFEAAMVLLLRPFAPAGDLVGALLAFRAIYYLVPLILGASLLGAHELFHRRGQLGRVAQALGRPLSFLVPSIFAFGSFAAGTILLLSGATPEVGGRLAWLRQFLPLPVLEVSHFLGSLVGAGLLILARGLQQRLDAAYFLTSILLGIGIATSLLKGLDYEEASVMALMLAALLPCRREFYRKASLTAESFSPGWTALISIAALATLWLALLSFRHVEYSNELWWRFAFSDEAPRALRATVGAVVFLLIFAAARLLRASPPETGLPASADLDAAAAVAGAYPHAYAHLALLGDKTLLFNKRRNAFLMYAVEGRSWVVMGDPVGPEEEARELLWEFQELADRADGWPVGYEVGTDRLPLYLDLGLTLLKIGEEGRVPLEAFSLEGGDRRGLRNTRNRLEREGCSFEVLSPKAVTAQLPELRAVSDQWLAAKSTREKGFSLGYFDEGYLSRLPCGVVRLRGDLLAFANLWPGGGKEEVSIDLMRYLPGAPNGVMDYLFTQIMMWGRDQGYRWFNLGMAPLSGLEARALAPLWSRMGAFVYQHGEHFYNFQGLREYKGKFDPVWEPRYLASPGGFVLPRILANVASLISGGVKGVMGK